MPIQPATRTWPGRPWEFAYILKIYSPEDYDYQRSKTLKDIAANDFSFLLPEAVFPQTISIETNPDENLTGNQAISVVVVEFDPNHDGAVLTPHEWPKKLAAHITDIDSIEVASSNQQEDTEVVVDFIAGDID